MLAEQIFRIAFWVLLGGVLAFRVYFAVRVRLSGERLMPDRQAVQREGVGFFVLRVVLFLILIAILVSFGFNLPRLLFFRIPTTGLAALDWLFLGIASLVLLAWTELALRKAWSAQFHLHQEHPLVTTGPYARVRHPLYMAMFGLGLAFALVTANWIFVAFILVIIFGLEMRVGKEEQMMIERFGKQYKNYMERTGRYFPK